MVPTEQTVEIGAVTPKASRGKRIGALFAVAVAGIIVGVLITANGLAKPIIGARYTQSELTKSFKVGVSTGYKDGHTAGYSSGKDDGYRTGYSLGCTHVFDIVGYTDIIGIRYPYNAFSTARTYYTQSYVCD